MILSCLLFSMFMITLRMQRTLASCGCKCRDKLEICEDLKDLRTTMDINTEDRKKWSSNLAFLEKFRERWKEQISNIVSEEIEIIQERNTQSPMLRSDAIMNITRTISAVENQNLELQANISAIKAKLHEAMDRTDKLESDLKEANKHFTTTISAAERQNLELLSNISYIEAKLHKAEDRAERLESDLNEADIVLENYTRIVSAVEKQNLELQSNISDIEKMLQKSEDRAEKLESDLNEANIVYENFTTTVSAVEKQNLELLSNISDIEVMLHKAEDKVEKLESDLNEANIVYENISMTLSTIERQNLELQSKISGTERKFVSAEDRAKKLESGLEKEKLARQEEFKNFSTNMSAVEMQNLELKSSMTDIEEKLHIGEYRVKKLESDLKRETTARKKLESKLKEANSVHRNFSIAVSTNERQNLELKSKVSGIEAKLHAAEDRAQNLESDLEKEKEARKVFENFATTISATEKQILELKRNLTVFEDKFHKSEERAEKLESDLNAADKKFSATISTIERQNLELESKVSGFEGKLRDAEGRAQKLESELEEERRAREEFEYESREIQSFLQTQNEELRVQIKKVEKILGSAENTTVRI